MHFACGIFFLFDGTQKTTSKKFSKILLNKLISDLLFLSKAFMDENYLKVNVYPKKVGS